MVITSSQQIKGPPRKRGFDTKATMLCEYCGSVFVGVRDPDSHRNYCSSACYQNSKKGSGNPNFKGGPITRPCENCGEPFTQVRNGGELRKGCSSECSRAILSASLRLVSPEQMALCKRARKAMHSFMRGNNGGRKWGKIFAFTSASLRLHLESMFTDGMTWDNHGEWHVDHILPTSSFTYLTTDCQGFKDCWTLSNLQPLWAEDNLKKGRKV